MKNVVLIGLGAVGLTYAVKFRNKCNLYILVDRERMRKYIDTPPIFNGVEQKFNYILPNEKIQADLIVIATKSNDLDTAISNIRNCISQDTIIISLINGISSEDKISAIYPQTKILKSYFIGHSAVRNNNSVTQDGVGELVIEYDQKLEEFLTKIGINFQMPKNIEYSMWLKYTLNMFSNPTSAILNMTFGELKRNKNFINFAKKIIEEVKQIAKYKGIKGLENLEKDAFLSLEKMSDDGKTSMLQDIIFKRPTEIDIFCGEIIKLGKEFGIHTPYNQVLYELIKIKEEDNEHSIHSC